MDWWDFGSQNPCQSDWQSRVEPVHQRNRRLASRILHAKLLRCLAHQIGTDDDLLDLLFGGLLKTNDPIDGLGVLDGRSYPVPLVLANGIVAFDPGWVSQKIRIFMR